MFGQEYGNLRHYLQKKGTSSRRAGEFGLGITLRLFNLCCNRSSTSSCCKFNLCCKLYSSGSGLNISLKLGTSGIKKLLLF